MKNYSVEKSLEIIWDVASDVIDPPRLFIAIASDPPSSKDPIGRCAFRSNIAGGNAALAAALHEMASKLEAGEGSPTAIK